MNRNQLLISALRGEYPWQKIPPSQEQSPTDILIRPSDLIPMLERYLAREVDENDLQLWADWVLNQHEFCVAGWEDDAVADYYEPMWYVLQQLSTPYLDGRITTERVKQHVSLLSEL